MLLRGLVIRDLDCLGGLVFPPESVVSINITPNNGKIILYKRITADRLRGFCEVGGGIPA